MKTYKTVSEWLESNPEKEVMERVLSTINRGAISEGRKELREKKDQLRKFEKVISQMEKLNLPVGEDISKAVKSLEKDIATLTKAIPPSKYAKKAKEEEKKD